MRGFMPEHEEWHFRPGNIGVLYPTLTQRSTRLGICWSSCRPFHSRLPDGLAWRTNELGTHPHLRHGGRWTNTPTAFKAWIHRSYVCVGRGVLRADLRLDRMANDTHGPVNAGIVDHVERRGFLMLQ